MRVLVIEDDVATAETLKTLLDMNGYKVRVAFNGIDGLKAAHDWEPDAIVSDIGLPGLDGFAVAREVRRDPVTAKASLIAVTAFGRDEDEEHAKRCGFDHFLVKPAEPQALLELLNR